MEQGPGERFTGLVCEERADIARPDRVEYQIGWKPFYVLNADLLAPDFKRILTEQAQTRHPVSISFDPETRRILAVTRSPFHLDYTEGPPPRPDADSAPAQRE
jgi:hypothetical protein